MTALMKLRYALLAMIVAFFMSVAGIAQAAQVDSTSNDVSDGGIMTVDWDEEDEDDADDEFDLEEDDEEDEEDEW